MSFTAMATWSIFLMRIMGSSGSVGRAGRAVRAVPVRPGDCGSTRCGRSRRPWPRSSWLAPSCRAPPRRGPRRQRSGSAGLTFFVPDQAEADGLRVRPVRLLGEHLRRRVQRVARADAAGMRAVVEGQVPQRPARRCPGWRARRPRRRPARRRPRGLPLKLPPFWRTARRSAAGGCCAPARSSPCARRRSPSCRSPAGSRPRRLNSSANPAKPAPCAPAPCARRGSPAGRSCARTPSRGAPLRPRRMQRLGSGQLGRAAVAEGGAHQRLALEEADGLAAVGLEPGLHVDHAAVAGAGLLAPDAPGCTPVSVSPA